MRELISKPGSEIYRNGQRSIWRRWDPFLNVWFYTLHENYYVVKVTNANKYWLKKLVRLANVGAKKDES